MRALRDWHLLDAEARLRAAESRAAHALKSFKLAQSGDVDAAQREQEAADAITTRAPNPDDLIATQSKVSEQIRKLVDSLRAADPNGLDKVEVELVGGATVAGTDIAGQMWSEPTGDKAALVQFPVPESDGVQ